MPLTLEILFFLGLFVVALILFATERFPADVTALGLMMALILTGLLDAESAFANFGSETVLMILGLAHPDGNLGAYGLDRCGGALAFTDGRAQSSALVGDALGRARPVK
jgi:hypothetical protein